jgi:diguanylate cyclase (GGDEF)-like protein
MGGHDPIADRATRRRSLRREWSRAFAIMLALLLVSAIATIVGVRGLVDQVRATARQLHVESVTVATLSGDVVAHEEVAHKLLSDETVDRTAFVQQQQEISSLFDHARTVFPVDHGMRATVVKAQQLWQSGLTTYGLWGTQVQALHGNHAADNPLYGASSDSVGALLGSLEGPSLDAMDRGLTHAGDLEWMLIIALICLFSLALAATVYYRRRMIRDLLQPVTTMHQGVLKLQAGEYDHRIAIARSDELGELAGAFNGMAGALRESHVALTFRATRDSLTGLLNRASVTERLSTSFAAGADHRTLQECVLFIDVDDFKEVNDSLGHEGGDALLIQLATRLNECVRPQDMVARLGGDEFAVVVVSNDPSGAAEVVAERILSALREPFTFSGVSLAVSASIGAAVRLPQTADAAELLRNADFAMYMAKGSGKNRFQLFDAEVHDSLVGRSALKADLALAVAADQLRLDYQPIIELTTGHILGAEALVRWEHPTRGLLPPLEFIALAEETGDICGLGSWVLEAAARQGAVWRRSIAGHADLWISVNVSPFQLADPDAVDDLRRVLADPSIEAKHIVLEITETALTADLGGGIAALHTLKSFGARVAIDDFGTGFSSLSTLGTLPVDILKIDRSFVSGQPSGAPSALMLEGILGLADRLSLPVIAEGIEEPEQLELLATLGCRMGQGYLLSRPISALALERLLLAGAILTPQAAAPVPS